MMDDAAIDRLAQARAFQYGVSYAEALTAVVASLTEGLGSDVTLGNDERIDQAAKAYARDHRVSYSEALDAVAVNFREGPASAGPAAALAASAIEIFKAGTHVDDNGKTRVFSKGDIQAMALAYDPRLREAPLVIGHPETDAPAQGWVERLEATEDGRLVMRARQVDGAFAESLAQGRYKKRSASFYAPGDHRNPVQNVWYLRHVGWLGARQPAVSGLRDLVFSGGLDCVRFTL